MSIHPSILDLLSAEIDGGAIRLKVNGKTAIRGELHGFDVHQHFDLAHLLNRRELLDGEGTCLTLHLTIGGSSKLDMHCPMFADGWDIDVE